MVSPGTRAFVCRRDTELAYQYFLTQKNIPLDRPGFEPTGARRGGGGARVGSAPPGKSPQFFSLYGGLFATFSSCEGVFAMFFTLWGGLFHHVRGLFATNFSVWEAFFYFMGGGV